MFSGVDFPDNVKKSIIQAVGMTNVFTFLKGGSDATDQNPEDFDWQMAASTVRSHIAEALSAQNLSFLLGSGCSSLWEGEQEVGIPTMGPMASHYITNVGNTDDSTFLTDDEVRILSDVLGITVTSAEFSGNLERLMEVLESTRKFLSASNSAPLKAAEATLDGVIIKIIKHITNLCSKPVFATPGHPVHSLYDQFYRKLTLRDRSLPRPWVFTTNYDLFSERAMDRASIPYINGFTGAVERRFNPASFRYALAQKLDLSSRKWSEIDSLVYLCKLHGSINWVENGEGLFRIEEMRSPPEGTDQRVMIYPSPTKQNASFGSPYTDLFREFQRQVVRDQSVMVSIGYGFGDEHVNNIIFQALTIPSFRLITFVDPELNDTTKALRDLQDPRIWFVYGSGPEEGQQAHFFDTIIKHFLPSSPGQKVETAIEKVLKAASLQSKSDQDGM